MDGSNSTGCNHEMIKRDIRINKPDELDRMQLTQWNHAAMSKEVVEAADKLWSELQREGTQLREECKGDDVERGAEWCQDTLSKIHDVEARNIRICTSSERWWKDEVKERSSALGSAQTRGRRSELAAPKKVEQQNSIRQCYSPMWNDYVQNFMGGKAWRAAKFTNHQVGGTVGVVTYRYGKQANSIAEKEDMVRRETFSLNDRDQY
jgi:hypothetical protein